MTKKVPSKKEMARNAIRFLENNCFLTVPLKNRFVLCYKNNNIEFAGKVDSVKDGFIYLKDSSRKLSFSQFNLSWVFLDENSKFNSPKENDFVYKSRDSSRYKKFLAHSFYRLFPNPNSDDSFLIYSNGISYEISLDEIKRSDLWLHIPQQG